MKAQYILLVFLTISVLAAGCVSEEGTQPTKENPAQAAALDQQSANSISQQTKSNAEQGNSGAAADASTKTDTEGPITPT